MFSIEESSKIVNKALDSYQSYFMKFIEEYANAFNRLGNKYCDFYVDIGSMMNGIRHLTAVCEFVDISEFEEFDWHERRV